MEYKDFEDEMGKMMNDPNKVYETQVREIYTMGQYLSRKKYKFLKYSYYTFITGILSSSFIYILGSYIWFCIFSYIAAEIYLRTFNLQKKIESSIRLRSLKTCSFEFIVLLLTCRMI